jgi:hypothetical protein
MVPQKFDLVVEGLSEEACLELLVTIQHFVEEAGGTVGGGFTQDEDAAEVADV